MSNLVVGSGVVEWVAKQTNEFGNFGAATGVGWKRNGEIVAGVAYSDFNGVNCSAHIAITGAMSREFLWTIFDYPFKQLKVNRVTCLIGEGNQKSRNLCLKLGFEEEARLLSAHPTGDIIVYRMRREECKWFGIKK